MTIVESGARRDLGEAEARSATLEKARCGRVAGRLVAPAAYAYAEALLADGQRARRREWFERAAAVDINDVTDAADRVADLGTDGG